MMATDIKTVEGNWGHWDTPVIGRGDCVSTATVVGLEGIAQTDRNSKENSRQADSILKEISDTKYNNVRDTKDEALRTADRTYTLDKANTLYIADKFKEQENLVRQLSEKMTEKFACQDKEMLNAALVAAKAEIAKNEAAQNMSVLLAAIKALLVTPAP